ncbi:MAG: hypothetical protein FWB73_01280 [Treponema sp.]|nr:hypothetical protein [Treponema sp.]
MKKILFILYIFVFTINLHSQSIGEGVLLYNEHETPHVAPHVIASEDSENEEDLEEDPDEKKSRRIKNRFFELGLINLDLGFANNLLGLSNFFQEKVIIDLSNAKNGFSLSFDLNLRPIFFNLNFKDRWGIGLDIANISLIGNINLSGKLLNFEKTDSDGDPFGVGAAAFVDFGIPVFFNVGKGHWEDREFKIKIRPAGFLTIAYAVPEMKYTFKDTSSGSLLEIAFGFKVYTPFSLNPDVDLMSSLDLGSSFGMDISAGIEYPLFSWIDVGVDFINIPIFPSGLNHYMEMRDTISIDSSDIIISDLFDGKLPNSAFNFPKDFKMTYGKSDRITILRPFKTLFFARYRPFNTPLFTLIPVLGFSINSSFVNIAMVEAGITVMCDIRNFFISSFGILYEDQMWKNSLDLVLNVRAFQFNLGVSMQSQSFIRSWTGSGVRLRLGFIFGW